MRARRVAAILLCVAVAAAARPRSAARMPPSDTADTEVFSGKEDIQPARPPAPASKYWRLRTTVQVAATPAPFRVRMFVPPSDGRQDVLLRRTIAPGFRARERADGPNTSVEWTTPSTAGTAITYDVTARVTGTTVPIPTGPLRARRPPPADPDALGATATIQTSAPIVTQRASAIVGKGTTWDEVVWSLYQYSAALLAPATPDAPQDARTVLESRRGTSLGRARALAALLRSVGVPARLVGGLRLEKAAAKRATSTWVEAWTGADWFPIDPAGGHFGSLPNDQLTLYRGDLPLIVHTANVAVSYGFTVRQTTRRAVEQEDAELEQGAPPARVETRATHTAEPTASVVLIADQSVPEAATDRILREAEQASIDCVLLTTSFESRYLRERELERLIAANRPLISHAHLLLVATADEAGAFALLELAERRIRLPDTRIIVAGKMAEPTARLASSLLFTLLEPGEVALVRRSVDLLPLWEIARANLLDGVPIQDEARRWGLEATVLGEAGETPRRWRTPLVRLWARVVRAEVPLPAVSLILTLPIIATVVVVARAVVGIAAFGTFGPVIVSLAFITTGLLWGTVSFVVIVGLGLVLRWALQRLRLQAVARLAILVALVAIVMVGLTITGAFFRIGPLLHLSVFPMLIMANVIESFGVSQVELGTRAAIRMTLGTFGLAVVCYLIVDQTGLQGLLLAYPEGLLLTVVADVLLGKWRGVRLMEYWRFLHATREEPGGAG